MGRRPLAVDFFLIAHDPFDDGRLRISTELLGCGLVGAELADLMLARRLGVEGDDLVLVALDGAPDGDLDAGGDPGDGGGLDEVDDYVLGAVREQESAHPVRAWVEPLQDGLYALVGDRLVASGAVRRQTGSRRLGRGRQPDRFPTDDLLAASRPQQGLEALLRAPKDLTLRAGTLAALFGVLGLDGLLPTLDRNYLRELLTEIEHHLPTDLRALCDGLRAVAADVSLRFR